MNLDYDFILYSTLLIGVLLPLYIYKDKILKKRVETGHIVYFLKDLKLYMSSSHPNITLDYSIIEKTKDQKDEKIRETLIADAIVAQYFNHPYSKNTNGAIQREKLWSGYDEKSKSNSKYPNDWNLRKEFAWRREDKKCNRCGQEIKIKDINTIFIRKIEEGGGYNLENIVVLCQDCKNIVNSTNPKKTINSLQTYQKLMFFVKG